MRLNLSLPLRRALCRDVLDDRGMISTSGEIKECKLSLEQWIYCMLMLISRLIALAIIILAMISCGNLLSQESRI